MSMISKPSAVYTSFNWQVAGLPDSSSRTELMGYALGQPMIDVDRRPLDSPSDVRRTRGVSSSIDYYLSRLGKQHVVSALNGTANQAQLDFF